jgi:hypothetical protein
MSYTLSRDGLDELLAAIRRQGLRLVGPVISDGAICYGDIASTADLPVGWTEERRPGPNLPQPVRVHRGPRGRAAVRLRRGAAPDRQLPAARPARRAGNRRRRFPPSGTVLGGAVPHHSFHVFCVYPWTGLLRAGRASPSLQVLDQCRIGWGQVVCGHAGSLVVRRRPLTWDGRSLALGVPEPRVVDACFLDAAQPAGRVHAGDWVSLHWDTACGRLTTAQLLALRAYTARHIRLVNAEADPLCQKEPSRLAGQALNAAGSELITDSVADGMVSPAPTPSMIRPARMAERPPRTGPVAVQPRPVNGLPAGSPRPGSARGG